MMKHVEMVKRGSTHVGCYIILVGFGPLILNMMGLIPFKWNSSFLAQRTSWFISLVPTVR